MSSPSPRNLKSVRCYDNGGKTFDRFTVVYLDYPERGRNIYSARGMSENPTHPQGFGQGCTAQLGRHLGKRIAFSELPEACRKVVLADIAQS